MTKIKFAILMAFGLSTSIVSAQQSINAGGGDGTGEGSFSVSYGQVLYTAVQSTTDDSNIIQGVQIPYEFYGASCPEDINLDGTVDVQDFIALNSAYGSSCASCREDINRDGTVDVQDFIALNSAYGTDCDAP